MATYQLHTIPGVEIFSAGTHRGEQYTRKDLDRIVRNFYRLQGDKRFGDTENRLDPTCVLGHEEDEDQMILKYSGLPAAGVVKRLRRKGDKLIADFADVPEPVANAVKNRNYRKVSAELYDNFEDGDSNLGLTLRRVALLGGEIPEIKNLADLPFPQVQKHSEQSAKKLYTFSELRFAPPKKRVRKFANGWAQAQTESGGLKAIKPGQKPLYGDDARRVLQGQQPKQQQPSGQRSPAMAKVSGAVSKAIQASKPVRKILSQAISKSKTMAKDVFNGLRKVAGYSAKKARQVMKKMFRVAGTMATNTMQFMGEVGKKYGPLSAMAAGAIYASTGLAAIGDDKNPTRRALARTVALWASKPIRLGGDAVKVGAKFTNKHLISNVLTELDIESQKPSSWFGASLFAARQMARGAKTVAKVAGKAGKLGLQAGKLGLKGAQKAGEGFEHVITTAFGFSEGGMNDKPNLKKITQAVNLIEKMVASASGTTPRKHSWRLVKKKLAEIFGNQSMKFAEIRKFGNWDYYRGSGKPSGDGWTEYKRRSGGVGYKRKRGSSGAAKKSSSRAKPSGADLDASRSLKLAIERGKEFGRKAQEAREKFEQAGSWEEKTRWRNEAKAFQQEAEREAAKARKLGQELRANRAAGGSQVSTVQKIFQGLSQDIRNASFEDIDRFASWMAKNVSKADLQQATTSIGFAKPQSKKAAIQLLTNMLKQQKTSAHQGKLIDEMPGGAKRKLPPVKALLQKGKTRREAMDAMGGDNTSSAKSPRFAKQILRLKGREAKAEAYVKGLEDEAQYHLDAYRSLDKKSRENSQRLREIQKRLQGLKVVPRQERSQLMKEQREREAKQTQMDAQLQRASDNMYSSFQRAKKARANIKKLTQGPRTMFAESKYIYTGKVPKGWKKVGDTPKGIKIAKVGGSGREFEIPKKPVERKPLVSTEPENPKKKPKPDRDQLKRRLDATTDYRNKQEIKAFRASTKVFALTKQLQQAKEFHAPQTEIQDLEAQIQKILQSAASLPDRADDAKIKNLAAKQSYKLAKLKAGASLAEYMMHKGTMYGQMALDAISNFANGMATAAQMEMGNSTGLKIPLGQLTGGFIEADIPLNYTGIKGMLEGIFSAATYAARWFKKRADDAIDTIGDTAEKMFAEGMDQVEIIYDLLRQVAQSMGVDEIFSKQQVAMIMDGSK